MAATLTRTCPVCFSDIDRRAKKCPQCHSPLGVYRFSAAILVLIFIFGALGFVVFITWAMSSRSSHQRPDHAAELKTVSSKSYFAPGAQNGKVATIVGILRNEAKQTVTSAELEVRFFNEKHELVDVFTSSYNGSIKTQEEMPFKINDNVNIHLPEPDYSSHVLLVTHAYGDD
jgi:hypothetical protein